MVLYSVELTRSFETNLDAIQSFLVEQEAVTAFARLIDHLFDELIPNLQHYPRMGRNFMDRAAQSVQSKIKLRKLKSALGTHTELREYIANDYLVLYAIRAQHIYLLSIRHHRQLSFDLKGHWIDPGPSNQP